MQFRGDRILHQAYLSLTSLPKFYLLCQQRAMGSAEAEATSSTDVPGDDERAEATETMRPEGNGGEESEEQAPNGERVEMGDNEVFQADADEETRLKQLATSMDQDDLERNIGRQVCIP